VSSKLQVIGEGYGQRGLQAMPGGLGQLGDAEQRGLLKIEVLKTKGILGLKDFPK